MKRNNIFKFLVIVLFIICGVSCTGDFDEINTDPDNSAIAPAANVFVYACQNSLHDLNDSWTDLQNAGCWAQHVAQIQYIDEDRYDYRTNTMNIYWARMYARDAKNFKAVVDLSVAIGTPNMEALGRIMKVWVMQNMTDLWGDIPYSEAFKSESDGNFTPVYDSQESIYTDFLAELELANGLFDADADEISDDIIYGGDIPSWKMFCNSLQLRVLGRMMNVAPTTAQAGIEKIMADPTTYPIFASVADNAQLQWTGIDPYEHPYFFNSKTRDDHAVSKTMIDHLINLNDPRLSVFAHPNESGGVYVGQPNGMTTNPQLDEVSKIGEFFRDTPNGIQFYMTYDEVLFILAEAALNGWSVGDPAAAYYNEAITACCEKYVDVDDNSRYVSDAQITAYLTEPNVDFAAVGDQRAAIGLQRWLSHFGNGLQAYHEYRRTGYPILTPPAASVYPGHNVPPFRFPYPTDEQTLNPTNFATANAEMDDFMWGKQVWWDVRAGVN